MWLIVSNAGHLAWTIVKGPLEAVAGILYGIIFGIILWYLPHSKHVSFVDSLLILSVIVALICLFARFVSGAVYSIGQIVLKKT